jgi:hypothetical protein
MRNTRALRVHGRTTTVVVVRPCGVNECLLVLRRSEWFGMGQVKGRVDEERCVVEVDEEVEVNCLCEQLAVVAASSCRATVETTNE